MRTNIQNAYINKNTGLLVTGQSGTFEATDYICVKPNTTYIVSQVTNGFANVAGVAYYDSNKTYISGATINIYTLNTPANARYLRYTFYHGGSTTPISMAQLEQGSTATTYEPYTSQSITIPLGNIELAKIGDYTDKLFKAIEGDSVYDSLDSTTKGTLTSGGWYKQGNTEKVVLDSSTEWVYEGSSTTPTPRTVFNRVYTPTDNILFANYLSNRFIYGSTTSNRLIFSANGNLKRMYLSIENSIVGIVGTETNAEKITKLQTYLASNNVIAYYQKATPTYTQITDTTLLADLENILAMHTNKNVTNAWIEPTGTNAQAGMVLVYRQDLQTVIGNMQTAILSL